MFKRILSIVVLFISVFSLTSVAKQLDVKSFAKPSEFFHVRLSPKGTYLAAKTTKEGKEVLAILDRKTHQLVHMVNFPGKNQVGDYWWVSDSRLVMKKAVSSGWLDYHRDYGELYAVNADGTGSKNLAGYKAANTSVSAAAVYNVLDPLLKDERNMLVTSFPIVSEKEPKVSVYKMDVYTGRAKRITTGPVRLSRYMTDAEGNVRVAVSTDDTVETQLYLRDLKSGKWQKFGNNESRYKQVLPISFTSDGSAFYAAAHKNGEPSGVYRFDLSSGQSRLISSNSRVSPSDFWVSKSSDELYAIEYMDGFPSYEFLDGQSKPKKRLKSLISALPGHHVKLVSETLDGRYGIVWAGNDRNPGDYYQYDATNKKLEYLFSEKNWLKPEDMAEMKPVTFQSRDGMRIDGYLTLPKGMKAENLPLVVMPHGGPRARDIWIFSPDVQLLASRGIAVLQVNFRGSSGYGQKFESAGDRHWGDEVQYDIIDGVKYALSLGIADKDNICIMGASFGGYSALQSAIVEPDLFRCAIGVVGIYDLKMMFDEGDISEINLGVKYLKRAIGTDEKQLKAFSPVFNVDKLKAPVLLIQSGEDQRAPIEQAEALRSALDKQNKNYEYHVFDQEGHGFFQQEDREKYYNLVLKFLSEHLDLK